MRTEGVGNTVPASGALWAADVPRAAGLSWAAGSRCAPCAAGTPGVDGGAPGLMPENVPGPALDNASGPAPENAPDLAQALQRGAEGDLSKRALVDTVEELTYAQAHAGALRFAAYLAIEYAAQPGDVLVVCLPNGVLYPVVLAACQHLGMTAALFADGIADAEFGRRVDLVKPLACVCENAEALRDGASVPLIAAATVRRIVRSGVPMPSSHAAASAPNADAAPSGTCDSVADPTPSRTRVPPGRLGQAGRAAASSPPSGIIVFTSGSTGLPKAVVCDARAFAHNAACMASSYRARPNDCVFVPPPFSHVFGLVGVWATLASGGTVATCARYRQDEALSFIASTGSTVQYGVSTMFMRQLRAADGCREALRSLRVAVVGGDACPAPVMKGFEQLSGCVMLQSWGMTEAASTLTATPLDADEALRASSVGAPVEGVEVRADAETGELLVRARSLARGFIDQAGFAPLPLEGRGWFRTGDVGSVGADGFVRIEGRLKDVIIRGGVNIYPAEVERLYRSRSDVADCCLVGIPDCDLGERTCLCVVGEPGPASEAHAAPGFPASELSAAGSANERPAIGGLVGAVPAPAAPVSETSGTEATLLPDLRRWALCRIEKCRVPDFVLAMKRLPFLPNGKIDKQALRKEVRLYLMKPLEHVQKTH